MRGLGLCRAANGRSVSRCPKPLKKLTEPRRRCIFWTKAGRCGTRQARPTTETRHRMLGRTSRAGAARALRARAGVSGAGRRWTSGGQPVRAAACESAAAAGAGAGASRIDPLKVVAEEMAALTGNIRSLLGSGCGPLDASAKYYVRGGGKSLRPLVVLLMSRAVSFAPKSARRLEQTRSERAGVDDSLSPLDILRDFNPSRIIATLSTSISRVAAAGLGAMGELER
ncbi:uncharacterized protein V1510DRAFT_429240, partial [Dipodascopsis tothii]|uniref:uncharacterized protein n=1 Tax=Dipodascopsis tothii TaxID=44089 RepID=UPI0034CF3B0E